MPPPRVPTPPEGLDLFGPRNVPQAPLSIVGGGAPRLVMALGPLVRLTCAPAVSLGRPWLVYDG